MKRSQSNREANIWVARGVPVFLLAIIGYASWVITKVLCIDYLLRPSSNAPFVNPQTGPAAVILAIYYVLLLVMLVCYARLIYVVTKHPGLVPRGSHWYQEKNASRGRRRSRSHRRRRSGLEKSKSLESNSLDEDATTEVVTNKVALDTDLNVEDFWKRDIFTCGYDGRPAFCSSCYNWKPDRAHHCSELDRCVLKMDHFCPWVGGVVGETSFKFFIQFTFWAALFCTHTLVSIAYYFAQRRRYDGVVVVHWAVGIGLAGLFFLFSAGMCMSSLQFACINSTTIENLNRKTKVWYLAVHIPDHLLQQIEDRGRSNLRLITFPRPAAEQFQVLQQNGADVSHNGGDNHVVPDHDAPGGQAQRTFAILETNPGTNPFDVGWKHNILDIMGTSVSEWLLPIKLSPCVRHDSNESFYKMGSAVMHLKRDARIPIDETNKPTRHQRSKHRRHRSRHHSRNQSRTLDS